MGQETGRRDRTRRFTDGTPVTERGIRRSLNLTILAGVFSNVWLSIIVGVPYQMYLAVLNASGKIVGLAGTITNLTMILQLPGAFLSERLAERRPLVVLFATVQRALWFIPAIMPLFSKDPGLLALTLVGVAILSAALGNFITGSWLAWMTDLIPNDKAGNYWGRRIAIVMPVYLGTTFLAGYALDILPGPWKNLPLLGFMVVFFVAGCASMLDMYWQWRTPEVTPEKPNLEKGMLERTILPLKSRDFRNLTLGYSVWFFVNSIFGAFSFIFLRQVHGISYHVIAFIAASSTLGTVVFGRISGYIIDRISARNYVIFCLILEPILTLYWFFLRPGSVFSFHIPWTGLTFAVSEPVAVLILGQFLFGAVTNAIWMAQMALLGVHAPKSDRSIAIAVHNCIIGLIAALGPILAGIFIDCFNGFHLAFLGMQWHYMQLLVLALLFMTYFMVIPFFLKLTKLDNELEFREAVGRLLFYNPFRVMRSMYNIMTLQNSTDAGSRAEAVEELGEENAAIAVKDLVDKMGDPSYEVREAAAKALGAIGSHDAVTAILALLKNQDIDLPITLIRSLRQNRCTEAIPLLIEKLDDLNPFVQREAARTLGALGGHEAIPRLRETLRLTDNPSVATASSVALAKLGCHEAMRDVYARYDSCQNPTLKKEMALAIAEMLIPGGDFYQVLAKEEKYFASQPEKLVSIFAWSVICLSERLSSSQTPGRTHHQNHLLAANQKEKARQLVSAYESNPSLAALLGCSIADDLSLLRFNQEAPKGREQKYTDGFLENLYDCDEHFGLGLYFWHQLEDKAKQGSPIQTIDLLIGIYFLALWCRLEATRP